MAQIDSHLSTGLGGLDRVLKGLIPGDNIVFHLESIDDYRPFLAPYLQAARRLGYPLIYFRFARHAPLVERGDGVEVHELNPQAGFEAFLAEIHKTIEKTGHGGYYVFDCLSDLAADWYSDQMLGNFFMLTCPYLYDMEAIAYFALMRSAHSFQATSAIADTAQVLLDVYRHDGRLFVHPWKVQARYSPTMHMLHVWEDDDFRPITASATIAEVLTSVPWVRLESSSYQLGVWNRTFLRATEAIAARQRGQGDERALDELFDRLLRMAVSRDPRVLALARKHLTIEDIVEIGKRMVGTGLIGGKSVGMLVARAILRAHERWNGLLEPHDSFFIGSDVFYTYLVRNGIWWVRERQKDPARFLEGSERARQRMLTGTFPDYIQAQFEDMLDYFGQSPIIVRSSSLLEDNFGNAFAGKYESVFCANQGPRHKRLDDFLSAVRTIYASTMSEKALAYRAQRGLLDLDEQMALLVQRVSGAMYGHNLYYPQIAGVGFSFNPYVWNRRIDPKAGIVRLVFGLGTRAVDRSDDDYTRVVALNAPETRPEASLDEVRQYSQRKVDVLDIEANQLVSTAFPAVAGESPGIPLDLFASRDAELAARAEQTGAKGAFPWVLTFDGLFQQTPFVADMREMLAILQQAYDFPVDVEFTANFSDGGAYKINVVQCRPLQIRGGGKIVDPPAGLPPQRVLVDAHGAVVGQSRLCDIERVIYVVPGVYGHLPVADRYTVARAIGKLTHADRPGEKKTILLLGPGRWGTTTPSLGVPVRFSDINTVSVLCEIVAMRDDLVPDVSLGTHFFSELVEMDMLYFALFPAKAENALNAPLLEGAPNRLAELAPEMSDWAHVVRVVDVADLGGKLRLNANPLKQRVVCYLE